MGDVAHRLTNTVARSGVPKLHALQAQTRRPIFGNMLGSRLKEDTLTEVLASALRVPELRKLFVEFLFAGEIPKELSSCATWEVQTQYRFSQESYRSAMVGSRGRLDLLLVGKNGADRFAVGVEHKVWDEEKPSRLHNYRLLLNGEKFTGSWLFEIVREKDYDIESEGFVVRVHRWIKLRDYLVKTAPRRSDPARSEVERLFSAMERSGALVEGAIARASRTRLGVAVSAEAVLDGLLQRLSDLDAKRTNDKGVPVHLRVGLPIWRTTHRGHWHQRLWIFVEQSRPDQFRLRMQVIFHNANFTDLTFATLRLPSWAPPFAKLGLNIYRGPDRGWDGDKRVLVPPPYHLSSRPKYFYAEEPVQIAEDVASRPATIEALVSAATIRARKYLEIFDSHYG